MSEAANITARRAPFADSPRVGARGQQTQQRILDATLRVLGEVGYHPCSVEAIAQAAGCSRAAFYQYFSGKEQAFGQLAARVVRQLDAAVDWLDPVTPDAEGWRALRAWTERYVEVYERNAAVFAAAEVAMEQDPRVAGASRQAGARLITGIAARISDPVVSLRELEALIRLLIECLNRTMTHAMTLRAVLPGSVPQPVLLDAYTDVVHRSCFGLLPEANVHDTELADSAKVPLGHVMRAAMAEDGGADQAGRRDGPTRDVLVAAAREVLLTHGYHGTRVEAIVEAAGLSRGTFYHYFETKDQLAQLLAARAMRSVARTVQVMPELPAPRAALRRWVREYARAQASETAMIRVWVDATRHDVGLAQDSAAIVDWARRRMVRFLGPRGFGTPDLEALVMLALLDALGARERSARTIDAAVHVLERGLVGR